MAEEDDELPSLGESLEPGERRRGGRPRRFEEFDRFDWSLLPPAPQRQLPFPRSTNVERAPPWPIPLALMEDPLFTRFVFGASGKHPIGELIGIAAGHPTPRRMEQVDPATQRDNPLSQAAGLDALLDITLQEPEGPSLQGFLNFLLGRGPPNPNKRLGEERERREREAEVQ